MAAFLFVYTFCDIFILIRRDQAGPIRAVTEDDHMDTITGSGHHKICKHGNFIDHCS